jgi:hypothetical protein
MRFRKDGIDPIARANAARDILVALPGIWTKSMPELEHRVCKPSSALRHPLSGYIRCEREQVLMDADSSLDHVFFPERGVVSVVAVYTDSVIEMATIGREGCTGSR